MIGRLEAQLEIAKDQLASALAAQETLKADISSLLEVAQVAVGNLQVALQQPKETKTTVVGVLAQFTELQGMRAERFKPGRNSSAFAETQQPVVQVPNPLRPH